MWFQSLALLSGLKIQRCCGCGVGQWLQLWFDPSLGTYICTGAALKRQIKKNIEYSSLCYTGLFLVFFFLGLHLLHMDVPRLWGGVGRIGAAAASHRHSNARSLSHVCDLHHSNAGSLTHWVRPRIKTRILMDTSQVLNLMSHNGNSHSRSLLVIYFICSRMYMLIPNS